MPKSPFKFCLFLLSNPEVNRVAKLLLRSFTTVSVRVGVTSKNLHPWDLPGSERSVEKIGSDTTFSSSCCSSSWAKRPMYNAARHPPGKMSQADMEPGWHGLKRKKNLARFCDPGFCWRLLLLCLIVSACISCMSYEDRARDPFRILSESFEPVSPRQRLWRAVSGRGTEGETGAPYEVYRDMIYHDYYKHV